MPAQDSILVRNTTKEYSHRVMIGTPTLGLIRMEWHNAVASLVVPCNWSNSAITPQGFNVADAQNIIAQESVLKGFEWMLLLEDDTVPPSDLLLRMNEHMQNPVSPMISGLYYLKPGLYSTIEPEPLMYRGRGTGAFKKWKSGDKVWVDGVPTGCLLMQGKLLRVVWENSEEYTLSANGQTIKLRRVFETPRKVFTDVVLGSYQKLVGTSDLYLCDRLLNDSSYLIEAGWADLARKKFPFLVDTAILCGHIDRSTGMIV